MNSKRCYLFCAGILWLPLSEMSILVMVTHTNMINRLWLQFHTEQHSNLMDLYW